MLTLLWLGIFTVLCGLTYNPNLSIPAPVRDVIEQAMLSLRGLLNLDSVHFIAGSNSLENSIAIIQPIFKKLFELQLDAGSVLIKLPALEGTRRIVSLGNTPHSALGWFQKRANADANESPT